LVWYFSFEQSEGYNESICIDPKLGKIMLCNPGQNFVKTYTVKNRSVHVELFLRRESELFPVHEHDSEHPFCKYEHIFLLDQSIIDLDKGGIPEQY